MQLKEATVIKDAAGTPTGQGLVVFELPNDAQKAIEVMNNKTFLGSVLRVSLAAQFGAVGGFGMESIGMQNQSVSHSFRMFRG